MKKQCNGNKMELLLDVVNNLRILADSIQAVADIMCDNEAPVQNPMKDELSTAPQKKDVSLEEVRGLLAEKSRLGFTAQVRELLLKHGAEKLSEIDPSEYEALLYDAEVIR